jgi:hypothetical protein
MFSIIGLISHSLNGKENRMVNLWTVSSNYPIGNHMLSIFEEISIEGLHRRREIENYSRVKGKESKDIQ